MAKVYATTKFDEWLFDNPNFYDDMEEEGLIDEATIRSLERWFGLRTVCDDVYFDRFYERQLEVALPIYNKLLRLEHTDFDALVNTYRERQTSDTKTETGSETTERTLGNTDTTSETKTATRTPDLTVTDAGTTSSSSETDTSGSGTTSGTGSNTSDSKSVAKQNPQSISYTTPTLGEIPALDWSYPGSQQQTDTSGSSSNSGSSTNSGTSETTSSGTTGNTNTTTGTDETVTVTSGTRTGTGSDEGTKETEFTKDGLIREQWTGRDNLTPQEALKSAMSYVKTSSAFVWLRKELEVCFLSVYEV